MDDAVNQMRAGVDGMRAVHSGIEVQKHELFRAVVEVNTAFGGEEAPTPQLLVDANRSYNSVIASLAEAQAMLTVQREAVEHYIVLLGY